MSIANLPKKRSHNNLVDGNPFKLPKVNANLIITMPLESSMISDEKFVEMLRGSYPSEPMQSSYPSEPMQSTYPSEPMQSTYPSEPMQSTYLIEPDYLRDDEDTHDDLYYVDQEGDVLEQPFM